MGKDQSPVISIDVIENDTVSRHQLRDWIKRMEAVTLVAEYTSYEDALAGLQHYTPELLIMEIGLRGGHGLEILRKIRIQYPAIRLLVFSTKDELLYAERALRAGAHGYLMKPATGAVFSQAVAALLGDQLYVSPAIEAKILRAIACQQEEALAQPDKILSNRELEIFFKIGQGMASKTIAEQLDLSLKTVETHRTHIKRKLGACSARELRRQAADWVAVWSDPLAKV